MRESILRWAPIATLVVTVLAFTFGVGVNWADIKQVKAKQDAVEATIPMVYVRQDVYASDQRRLSESIERLNRTLEKMEGATSALRTRTSPAFERGRVFD